MFCELEIKYEIGFYILHTTAEYLKSIKYESEKFSLLLPVELLKRYSYTDENWNSLHLIIVAFLDLLFLLESVSYDQRSSYKIVAAWSLPRISDIATTLFYSPPIRHMYFWLFLSLLLNLKVEHQPKFITRIICSLVTDSW